jgi:hypothetical protein
MLAKGIKMQVLGGVLFCLGAVTVLLANLIGFELDIFYIAIGILGAALFLFGTMQRKQQMSATEHYCGFCAKREATTDRVQSLR